MPYHAYDVETYNTKIKSELNTLWIIGAILLIIIVAIVVYSIVLIRDDKTKKFPYIQLICVCVIAVFLIISFSSSIFRYSKDLSDEAYVQYEGPASIVKKRKMVLGNIPTWYNEYVVTFNNNGENVELSTRKDNETEGSIEKIYIVYAENSGEILEFNVIE